MKALHYRSSHCICSGFIFSQTDPISLPGDNISTNLFESTDNLVVYQNRHSEKNLIYYMAALPPLWAFSLYIASHLMDGTVSHASLFINISILGHSLLVTPNHPGNKTFFFWCHLNLVSLSYRQVIFNSKGTSCYKYNEM